MCTRVTGWNWIRRNRRTKPFDRSEGRANLPFCFWKNRAGDGTESEFLTIGDTGLHGRDLTPGSISQPMDKGSSVSSVVEWRSSEADSQGSFNIGIAKNLGGESLDDRGLAPRIKGQASFAAGLL